MKKCSNKNLSTYDNSIIFFNSATIFNEKYYNFVYFYGILSFMVFYHNKAFDKLF